jgi:uncharacterized protein YjeT (DUF2065 family)
MSDFFAALGLVLAIEGVLFAGFPGAAKKAGENMLRMPDSTLRALGVASAMAGVAIVWLVRG